MIKYILILQICSLTAKDCIEPVRMPDPYDSHYECALAGYEHSIDAFKIIGKDVFMAAIGLLISLILALVINKKMQAEFVALF